jgi:hypothetical protein
MQKLISGVVIIAALTACSSTTTVVRVPAAKPAVTKSVTAKPTPAEIKTVQPKPTAAKTATRAPRPTASVPAPAPAPSSPATAPSPGYLGDIFGGGTGNPCNFASGYQLGDCNPTGETELQDPNG